MTIKRKDEMNNPYSKKSIDFVYVDLLRSIDRLLLKKKGHILFFSLVYYTADNQYYVIVCLFSKQFTYG